MNLKFNKDRREGLARYMDTVSVAALIAGVASATGHGDLSNAEMTTLLNISVVLLVSSFFLRKGEH